MTQAVALARAAPEQLAVDRAGISESLSRQAAITSRQTPHRVPWGRVPQETTRARPELRYSQP
jgi:hypothetical protein